MNEITFFGLTFELSPVAFTLPIGNGWEVYWYGIMIALGFLLAIFYGIKRAPLLGIDTDRLLDGIIITVPIAILCARAYYIIFDESTTFADFLKIHDGGLAIYGGIIGAMIGAVISCKTRKLKFTDTVDLIAPCLFIGQAIGRWGNFFNQEAFGTNTTLPWGMYSEGSSTSTYSRIIAMNNPDLNPELPVHPCFLYEFIWCAIGFLILNCVIKRRKFRGQLILFYGMWYGLGRAFIEGLRTDSLMIGSLRVSQCLSIAVAIASAVWFFVLSAKSKANGEREEYVPVFGDGEFSEIGKEDSDDDSNETES